MWTSEVPCGTNQEDTNCYLPTPDEIRSGCEEIQAGWNETTRISRLVVKPQPIEVTMGTIAEVGLLPGEVAHLPPDESTRPVKRNRCWG